MVRVRAVAIPDEKAAITAAVLHALPDWFGIPASTENYIRESRSLPLWAALDEEDAPAGFLALKMHYPHSAEVYVMGVLPHLHRQGVGKALLETAVARCRQNGVRFLQVKTVDDSAGYESYRKTLAFYEFMGFLRLECLPGLWGEGNPCLVLVMPLEAR